MENGNKCPVCGRGGLKHYLSEDVVCPCCGTDLRVYRLVGQISKSTKGVTDTKPVAKSGLWCYVCMGLAIIACVALGCVAISGKRHSNILEAEKAVLIDKVTSLDARIDSLKSLVPETVQKKFLYTVRHGDSFWRISYKLYGTGTRAAEIADMNGLTVNSSLHPGDTLSIE